MTNGYDKLKLGFDRTQLWKEYESDMIIRQTALRAAQSFYDTNKLEYTPTELKLLYNRFLSLIKDGDDSFFDKLELHIQKKKEVL